jgi:uncharacterized protein
MNIVLFGATGMIGQRIYAEAISRGHAVTVFARPQAEIKLSPPAATVVNGDVNNPAEVAKAVRGYDAVISALGLRGSSQEFLTLNQSLVKGLQQAGVRRLLVVGGAGSLEVAPGVALYDTPDFPKAWLDVAKIHGEVLALLKTTDLDWTYISPPALIQPGNRTGKYRRGANQLLLDEKGNSEISAEDYAIALVDELENPRGIQKQITVAW